MSNWKFETEQDPKVSISDRELKHHMRYFGTSGFTNPDGSLRVPTEQEVVDHGFEPPSYLVDPIPDEPRSGLCGVGKTDLHAVMRHLANS